MLKLNKSLPALLASAMALVLSSHAFAEVPSAELKVAGKIAPPACTVAGANNGDYDYGTVSPAFISPGTKTYTMPATTQTWTVTCDAPTFLTFQVIDNEAATASTSSTINFGLGNINDTGKIGYYTVTMSKPLVDGARSYAFATMPGASDLNGTDSKTIDSSKVMGWAATTAAKSPQHAGKVFVADLTVQPYLAGSTDMNGAPTENVPLNGSLTLNYAFGL
jgi:hypothetical protein